MSSGTTANYGFRYPIGSDPVDVATDFQNLATDVDNALLLKATLASPNFTGTPLATTAAVDTNSTQIATTAFVIGQQYLKIATASSTYLTQSSASSTYLTQSSAASTYLTQTSAASSYAPLSSTTTITINNATLTSNNYTLLLTDAGKVIEINSSSANTITIPTNTVVAFPIGSTLDIIQTGTGQTSIVGADGTVILQSPGGKVKLTSQYSAVTIYKRSTNTWALMGDLSS
jgi:hypothetical protein